MIGLGTLVVITITLKMIKLEIYTLTALILTFIGCSSGSEKQIIDEYVNSEGQNVIEYQLNDSIIERVMVKHDKIEARELENTKSDTIEIFYYNENKKLYQSIKFNTKNPNSIVINSVHYSDGGVAEKHIKNQENEKLATFKYNFYDNLEKVYYYREGQLNINAYVSYRSNGKIDNRKGQTSYLKIIEKDDSLFIHLVGNDKRRYQFIDFHIFDKYPEEPDEIVHRIYEKKMLNVEYVSLSISELKKVKGKLNCAVSFCNPEIDGILNCYELELFIESLDKIPPNNLYYIRKI